MNWNQKIQLSNEWQRAKAGELAPQELSKIVADKLSRLSKPDEAIDEALEAIIEGFRGLQDDPCADFDDFDYVYDDLCNWGDDMIAPNTKRCWIAVF